jgi:hypothetical protein
VVRLTLGLRWTAFGLLLVAFCASSGVAWWQAYRSVGPSLPAWRRRPLRFAAVTNAVSLLLYLGDLARFQLVMRGLVGYRPSGWADTWALLALFGVGLGSAACGAFGRGLARPLTIANGVVMAALWYFLALGTTA